MRDYLYISWILWAYLVNEEQQFMQQETREQEELSRTPNIYTQMKGKDCQFITFNYTTFARQASETALYFHGSLREYVDVENKNDLVIDNLSSLNLADFFKNQLAAEISFDADRKSIPIPSFLPPLKLQTVISKHYIDTWYHASQMMVRASKIILLGCSFTVADNYFCEMLRENREAQIVIIDKDLEIVSRNVCRVLQLLPNKYSRQIIDGKELRKYDNRITIIQSDLSEVDLQSYLG